MEHSRFSRDQLHDVSGLVVVVTGGGTGVGLVIAQAFEHNGAAKVYITGRRADKLEAAAASAKHGNIIPIQGDVTSHDDIQRAVDQIAREVGHIDVFVANAGTTTWDSSADARPMPTPKSSVAEIRDYFFNYRPASVWNAALETNVTAVFTSSMAFLELLDAGNKRRGPDRPRSQIIAIGSVGGMNRFTPSFVYNASKAGLHHLMKNMGAFLVPHNIRANVLALGWFPSEMTAPVSKQWEHSNGVMPQELVPQERMGNEEELAGTVLYLASKAGGYMNGGVLLLDGGFLHNHAGP